MAQQAFIKKLTSIVLPQSLKLHQHRSQGFTLIEVMVSIILLTAFLSIGMTALATASLVKARANATTFAGNWIEEDLEQVRAQANLVTYTSSRCNPSGTNLGFAYALQQNLNSVAVARGGTYTMPGTDRTYTLDRTVTVSSTAPYEVLQLVYTVQASQSSSTPALNSNSTVTTMYTEVIPNAAFQCSRS